MLPFELHVSADVEHSIAGVPELQALAGYWRSKAPGGGLPGIGDIDIADLDELLPNIMFLEVVGGGDEFVYIHYGSAIADKYGRDMTGQELSELRAIPVARFFELYRRIIGDHQPLYTLHRIQTTLPSGIREVCWERLMLPVLDDDGAAVARILAINLFRDWTYREHLYEVPEKEPANSDP